MWLVARLWQTNIGSSHREVLPVAFHGVPDWSILETRDWARSPVFNWCAMKGPQMDHRSSEHSSWRKIIQGSVVLFFGHCFLTSGPDTTSGTKVVSDGICGTPGDLLLGIETRNTTAPKWAFWHLKKPSSLQWAFYWWSPCCTWPPSPNP